MSRREHSHSPPRPPSTPFQPGRRRPEDVLTAGLSRLQLHPSTPHQPTSLATPGAPKHDSQRRLIRLAANANTPKRPAHEVLLEHLLACRPLTVHYAKVNDRAKAEKYDQLPYKVVEWEREKLEEHQYLDQFFKAAILHHDQLVAEGKIEPWKKNEHSSQIGNELLVEADVVACVRANALNPLADLFTSFIDEKFRAYLHVVIRDQENVRPKTSPHNTSSSPPRLDHYIFLANLDPRLKKERNHDLDYDLKVPLVVVEEKAPGIMREEDWRPRPSHPHNDDKNWMTRLLPQLFMYSDWMSCKRFFLTDYTTTYGVRIEEETLHNAVQEMHKFGKAQTHHVEIETRSATAEADHDSYNKDPYDFGFRPALAYEVYLALFELGVADPKLVDKHMHADHTYQLDEGIRGFLKTYVHRNRRLSQSPTRGKEYSEFHTHPPSISSESD
ncbi:uncharacterized protein JCM6883_002988 [Sporobolomyces salmoneus]|uniref:uncharacterized protein n=1 Tax=Sporobolomyces salmoneus TaxID=183962 RepID=UPI0031756AE2